VAPGNGRTIRELNEAQPHYRMSPVTRATMPTGSARFVGSAGQPGTARCRVWHRGEGESLTIQPGPIQHPPDLRVTRGVIGPAQARDYVDVDRDRVTVARQGRRGSASSPTGDGPNLDPVGGKRGSRRRRGDQRLGADLSHLSDALEHDENAVRRERAKGPLARHAHRIGQVGARSWFDCTGPWRGRQARPG
jgi:hypothetical protein